MLYEKINMYLSNVKLLSGVAPLKSLGVLFPAACGVILPSSFFVMPEVFSRASMFSLKMDSRLRPAGMTDYDKHLLNTPFACGGPEYTVLSGLATRIDNR